jgi:hypothetical protein
MPSRRLTSGKCIARAEAVYVNEMLKALADLRKRYNFLALKN